MILQRNRGFAGQENSRCGGAFFRKRFCFQLSHNDVNKLGVDYFLVEKISGIDYFFMKKISGMEVFYISLQRIFNILI